MQITLYTPDGQPLSYTEAQIDSNLIPDLSFIGTDRTGKRVHVSTSLGYLVTKEIEPNA